MKKSNRNVQKRNNIIKTKNWTLAHYPFIPPQKRRGSHIAYQKPYTIKRILTECIDLKPIRQKYYQTTNLKQIFYQINPKKLLG